MNYKICYSNYIDYAIISIGILGSIIYLASFILVGLGY